MFIQFKQNPIRFMRLFIFKVENDHQNYDIGTLKSQKYLLQKISFLFLPSLK